MVVRAEAALGDQDHCVFCDVMPAAIAEADDGDVEAAVRYLERAEVSVGRWEGTAWDAAVAEARAHLARPRGEHHEAQHWIDTAPVRFTTSGQPLDAARCAATAADWALHQDRLTNESIIESRASQAGNSSKF